MSEKIRIAAKVVETLRSEPLTIREAANLLSDTAEAMRKMSLADPLDSIVGGFRTFIESDVQWIEPDPVPD